MSSTRVEHKNRRQFTYSLRPGSTLVFGKIEFGAAGAVSSYSDMTGVQTVTKVNPTSTTGKYRIEFEDRYLDLVGFWASNTTATNGDGYDCALVDEFVHGFGNAVADAYQDGYCHIQFFQGGTAKNPARCTVFLHFIMKTSEQG